MEWCFVNCIIVWILLENIYMIYSLEQHTSYRPEGRYRRQTDQSAFAGQLRANEIEASHVLAGSVKADKIIADRIKARHIRAKFIGVGRRKKFKSDTKQKQMSLDSLIRENVGGTESPSVLPSLQESLSTGHSEDEGILKAKVIKSKQIKTRYIKAKRIRADRIHASILRSGTLDVRSKHAFVASKKENINELPKNINDDEISKPMTAEGSHLSPDSKPSPSSRIRKEKRRKSVKITKLNKSKSRRIEKESTTYNPFGIHLPIPTIPPEFIPQLIKPRPILLKESFNDAENFPIYRENEEKNDVMFDPREEHPKLDILQFLGLSDDYVKNTKTESQKKKEHPSEIYSNTKFDRNKFVKRHPRKFKLKNDISF